MTDNAAAELRLLKIAYDNKPSLWVKTYNNKRTCVLVVDMVEGFCRTGALASPRAAAIINPLASVLDYLSDAHKIFICDTHSADAAEFKSYPPHCHTQAESAVVKELQPFVNRIIPKNSTNGIFALLGAVDDKLYDNYLVTGVCTDICVLQLALSLKAYFNETNSSARVLTFVDYTETYDAPNHNAELHNAFAYKLMEDSGVQIFKNLK